jgi:D-glycero-D-manno-heptose 1,7-bisphosphate phosphatase
VSPAVERSRPAVFLDRDGTVIDEVGHLGEPERVVILPGVPTALTRLAEAGYALVMITNQAGVARGYFTEVEVEAVNARTAELLQAEGVRLERWYHCPHHPDFTGACDCRKPLPGMLHRAAKELDLDLSRSWMVGDHPSDAEAGRAAGARSIMVRTGHGMLPGANHGPPPGVPVVDDLASAVGLILEGN